MRHDHLLWDLDKVNALITDQSSTSTLFNGGSRNFSKFVDLLDCVSILEVADLNILYRRLDERVARDPTDWGGKPEEKELVARLHQTKKDTPVSRIFIDATQTLIRIMEQILRHIQV